MTTRLPVTVVTGFLGAGKTTLLRRLLLESGQRLAVLVNEFGEVGIDGDLIASCGFCPEEEVEGRVIELTNGCLCCTVQEDFLPTMEALLERRDRLDGIVVETSGLALPAPLVAAFGWPGIRSRVRVQAVVTVVDGEALAAGHVVGDAAAVEAQRRADPSLDHLSALEDLFDDQLQAADLVLVSRADRLEPQTLADLIADLQPRLRPGTGVLAVERGRIDPALILDLRAQEGPAPGPDAHQEARADGQGQPHHNEADSQAHSPGHSHDPGQPEDSRRSAASPSPMAGDPAVAVAPQQPHGPDPGGDPSDHTHGDHSQHHRQAADSHDHDDHDDHDHDHDHAHAAIASLVLQHQGHWSREVLEAWLLALIRDLPILRLKGRLLQADRSLPLQIQAVGPRLECWYEGERLTPHSTPGLELVLLTAASQAEEVRRHLEDLPQQLAVSPGRS